MSIAPCPPQGTPPAHGIVVFDPAVFVQLFPQFSTVPAPALQFNFTRATMIVGNACGSRVQDANKRELLLNLITAHITAINNGENGYPVAGIVGRVSETAQGSVSVSAEMSSTVGQGQAYFMQTRYGVEAWQAMAPYRLAVWIPPPGGPCATMLSPAGDGYGGYGYPYP